MTKTFIHIVTMFVILVLAQATVFNHICLFGVAVPLVFIYLIVKLPVTMNVNTAMTIGFLLGISVDIFSDTQGMNALACTILSAVRLPVLRLYFPREDEMSFPLPSIRSLGTSIYLKYVFSLCVVYCTLFFLIESFSFLNLTRMILKIISSSVLTFVILIAFDSLTYRSREKRL